ncbi:hypothetical protein B0H19DRAFT_1378984 [Mycena capillaripes]|nr:hypothetical protein B0H19DRAFT_1378984 [Mycena capillaripes]
MGGRCRMIERSYWRDAVRPICISLLSVASRRVNPFDIYAELSADAGWSWNQLFPYFLKNEKWTLPADHHDTRGQFNPPVHGTNGPIFVSLNGFSLPTFEHKVIQTTKKLPRDFPFNLDPNSGKPLGVYASVRSL